MQQHNSLTDFISLLGADNIGRVFLGHLEAGQFLRSDSREQKARITHSLSVGHQGKGALAGRARPGEAGIRATTVHDYPNVHLAAA